MSDDLIDSIHIVRAFGLIEPFAERLREADGRAEGEPVPNYEPLVDELNNYSGRVEAIAETYPDSPYQDELREIADAIRLFPHEYSTKEGIDDRLEAVAAQLETLADKPTAQPTAFDDVLDEFESLIVILDTLHKAYTHLVEETDLVFATS